MNKKLFVVLIILYRFLLDSVYSGQIAPWFRYQGLLDEHSSVSYIISWVFLAIVTFPTIQYFKEEEDYAISCVALLFYFMRIIPLSSILYFVPQPNGFVILNLVYWCLFFYLLNSSFGFVDKLGIEPKGDSKSVGILAFYCIFIVLLVSGIYANFRVHISLEDVYTLREDSRNFNMPLLLKYLFPPVANILPIVIIYYYKNSVKFLVFLLLFIGILNFSVNGSKSALFKIILCSLFVLLSIKDVKNYILPFCILLIIISLFEFYIFSTNDISSLIIRRNFYIPCIIDTFVYDYISNNQPLFFNSDATATFDFLIGENYFGNANDRANNGMFSDAYKNLGYIGTIIMPFIVVSFIKIFSVVTKDQDKGIIFFSALIITNTLEATSFTTCLLTHGLFLLLLALYYMPNINKQND